MCGTVRVDVCMTCGHVHDVWSGINCPCKVYSRSGGIIGLRVGQNEVNGEE